MSAPELQSRLDSAVDEILDLLAQSVDDGVELDPLGTIVARLQARGEQLDTEGMPPMMQMLLGGMLG